MVKVGILNSDSIRYEDVDVSTYAKFLLTQGVVSWLIPSIVWSNIVVAPGMGMILCTRSNGDEVMVPISIKNNESITTINNKILCISIPQANIDNPSLNTNKNNIASLSLVDTLPDNSIKLGVVSSWGVMTVDQEISWMTDSMFLKDIFINGTVNFNNSPKVPNPIDDEDAVNKLTMENALTQAWVVDHLSENIFMAGEAIAKNDSLYVERMISPTPPDILEFGKTTADKRVVLYGVGEWVASNKIKLWLKKFASPSVDISVRIETVDWSGIATGTLVNANAYGTTLTSGLTTSVTEIEISLNGTFTIPKGTNVAVILYAGTYWSETINGTNYFGLACKTQVVKGFKYGLYNTSYTNYNNKMVYFSSPLLANILLCKTSASQNETLPIDYISRFASIAWLRGHNLPVYYLWEVPWFSSLEINSYFYWNTDWTISLLSWTKKCLVWMGINKNTLFLWNHYRLKWSTTIISQYTWGSISNWDTSKYTEMHKFPPIRYFWMVNVDFNLQWGNWYTANWRILVNWVQVYEWSVWAWGVIWALISVPSNAIITIETKPLFWWYPAYIQAMRLMWEITKEEYTLTIL